MVDLNNKVDLRKYDNDPQEKFKYLFPFYRLDIRVFEKRMNLITGIPANSKNTEIISIQ